MIGIDFRVHSKIQMITWRCTPNDLKHQYCVLSNRRKLQQAHQKKKAKANSNKNQAIIIVVAVNRYRTRYSR